jgi:uncharacterized surface protein with fasciclin (FAS1) repeats
MVFHINSRLLNSLGLLSAGILLASPNLANAQAGAPNANPSALPTTAAPAVKPPTVPGMPSMPGMPAVTPSSPLPKAADPMVKPLADQLKPKVASSTIVDVAAGNGSFKTLVAAVKAAGLAETLMSEGPFTVFAPTDAAFAALPKGVVETLLKPENKGLLTKILAYHVVAGKVLSTDLKAGSVASLEGSPIVVKLVAAPAMSSDKAPMDKAPAPGDKTPVKPAADPAAAPKAMTTITVNQAQVKIADVPASNGVIHAIDQVILPADVMEQLSAALAASKPAAGQPAAAKPAGKPAAKPAAKPAVKPAVMPK